MSISVWDGLSVDWTNLYGQDWNVQAADLEAFGPEIRRAGRAAAARGRGKRSCSRGCLICWRKSG